MQKVSQPGQLYSRFQKIATFTIFQGVVAYDWIFHALFFLEKLNKYECYKGDLWVPCTKHEICRNEESTVFRAVTTDPFYLDNWVSKLDLLCESDQRIGYIGSAFFVGLLSGLAFIPTVSDKFGRRPVFNICLIFSVIF